jgi:hypothetical protein
MDQHKTRANLTSSSAMFLSLAYPAHCPGPCFVDDEGESVHSRR